MPKRVLDVGNCAPDHAAICRAIQRHFDAEVIQAHGPDDALPLLRQQPFDLVLVNRKLDRDSSDGLEVLGQIRQDPALSRVPVMLITNYAEHQQRAVEAGAVPGFGKLTLEAAETLERLRPFLAS